MVMAPIFTLTRRCLLKYRGIITRAEDTATFWQTIALCCLLGIFCLVFYLYTYN